MTHTFTEALTAIKNGGKARYGRDADWMILDKSGYFRWEKTDVLVNILADYLDWKWEIAD